MSSQTYPNSLFHSSTGQTGPYNVSLTVRLQPIGLNGYMLPSWPRTLDATISHYQISLDIAQLGRPSTSPIFIPLPIAHDFNQYNKLEFCPPGSRTGTIAVGFRRTNHLATGMWCSGYSNELQNPIFDSWSVTLLTSQCPPKLSYFSGYSSLLAPQFSAEAMNLFHNIRRNNKMSSQIYPNFEWLYTPLTAQDFSWTNNQWSNITDHSPLRPPTYPVSYLEP